MGIRVAQNYYIEYSVKLVITYPHRFVLHETSLSHEHLINWSIYMYHAQIPSGTLLLTPQDIV